MGTSLKGKNLLPEGAVPYGMENRFYHIRWSPLNDTIFITHVRNCVMGAATTIKGLVTVSVLCDTDFTRRPLSRT